MSSVSPTVPGREEEEEGELAASAIKDDPGVNKIPLPTGEGDETPACGHAPRYGLSNTSAAGAPPSAPRWTKSPLLSYDSNRRRSKGDENPNYPRSYDWDPAPATAATRPRCAAGRCRSSEAARRRARSQRRSRTPHHPRRDLVSRAPWLLGACCRTARGNTRPDLHGFDRSYPRRPR